MIIIIATNVLQQFILFEVLFKKRLEIVIRIEVLYEKVFVAVFHLH